MISLFSVENLQLAVEYRSEASCMNANYAKKFRIKHLGGARNSIGLKIFRAPSGRKFRLCHTKYALNIHYSFEMAYSGPMDTTMETCKLLKGDELENHEFSNMTN